MLLRKQIPNRGRMTDMSMKPQNYALVPQSVEVRGRILHRSVFKEVPPEQFVNSDTADMYSLQAVVSGAYVPTENYSRPFFTPSIDDVAEMQRRMEGEQLPLDNFSDNSADVLSDEVPSASSPQ